MKGNRRRSGSSSTNINLQQKLKSYDHEISRGLDASISYLRTLGPYSVQVSDDGSKEYVLYNKIVSHSHKLLTEQQKQVNEMMPQIK